MRICQCYPDGHAGFFDLPHKGSVGEWATGRQSRGGGVIGLAPSGRSEMVETAPPVNTSSPWNIPRVPPRKSLDPRKMGLADEGLDTRTAGLEGLEARLRVFDFAAALVDGGLLLIPVQLVWSQRHQLRQDTRQGPSPAPGLSGLIPGPNCLLVGPPANLCLANKIGPWEMRPKLGHASSQQALH